MIGTETSEPTPVKSGQPAVLLVNLGSPAGADPVSVRRYLRQFLSDRRVIEGASNELRFAAGNFYINDKPTGAVVGQQPFGGARASGTNDKAGSWQNLIRWMSPRTIKETFVPPVDHTYPHMR